MLPTSTYSHHRPMHVASPYTLTHQRSSPRGKTATYTRSFTIELRCQRSAISSPRTCQTAQTERTPRPSAGVASNGPPGSNLSTRTISSRVLPWPSWQTCSTTSPVSSRTVNARGLGYGTQNLNEHLAIFLNTINELAGSRPCSSQLISKVQYPALRNITLTERSGYIPTINFTTMGGMTLASRYGPRRPTLEKATIAGIGGISKSVSPSRLKWLTPFLWK